MHDDYVLRKHIDVFYAKYTKYSLWPSLNVATNNHFGNCWYNKDRRLVFATVCIPH
jgi:hypothetical protein